MRCRRPVFLRLVQPCHILAKLASMANDCNHSFTRSPPAVANSSWAMGGAGTDAKCHHKVRPPSRADRSAPQPASLHHPRGSVGPQYNFSSPFQLLMLP